MVAIFHEATDDPAQLLVCILLVELVQSLSSILGLLFFSRFIIHLFDCMDRLVEYIMELPIGFLELLTELDIHVGSYNGPCNQSEP